MRERAETLLRAGLLLLIAYMVVSRGAYYRLYWHPAWIFGVSLFAAWMVMRVHKVLAPSVHRLPLAAALPLALYLGLAILSLPSSVNPEVSRHEILRVVLVVMIYVMVLNLMCRPERFRGAYWFLVALGLAEAVYGITQHLLGPVFLAERGGYIFKLPGLPYYRPPNHQVVGTFLDHSHFATLIGLTLFPALALMGLPRRELNEPMGNAVARWSLKALAPAIMIGALVLSMSRAGWASCLFGLAVFSVLFTPWRRLKLWWWLPLAFILIAGTLATVTVLNYSHLHGRAKTVIEILTQKDSRYWRGRIVHWEITLEMAKERPLFGSGVGTYRYAFPAHRAPEGQFGGTLAHNHLLHIAAETGVLSAIAFGLWFGLSWLIGFLDWRRNRSPLIAASLASLAAAFFHGLFATHLQMPGFFALIAFHLALVVCRPESADTISPASRRKDKR